MRLSRGAAVYPSASLRIPMDSTKDTRELLSGRSSDGWSDPRVGAIVGVFKRHLSRRVTIDELAAIVRLSSSGLRRLFKQQMGCSIGRWQKNERLRVARHLLCTTCLSESDRESRRAVGVS